MSGFKEKLILKVHICYFLEEISNSGLLICQFQSNSKSSQLEDWC